jgi:hypothetical protein
MELVTLSTLNSFKSTYDLIEKMYADSFPEHASN